MSQIPTESKIPEREKQLLRREGWLAHRGCTAGANDAPCGLCLNEVALVFPLPKITRPLRGRFSDDTEAYAFGDGIHWRRNDEGSWRFYNVQDACSAFLEAKQDVLLLARMLSGETEEVEDDGESHGE